MIAGLTWNELDRLVDEDPNALRDRAWEEIQQLRTAVTQLRADLVDGVDESARRGGQIAEQEPPSHSTVAKTFKAGDRVVHPDGRRGVVEEVSANGIAKVAFERPAATERVILHVMFLSAAAEAERVRKALAPLGEVDELRLSSRRLRANLWHILGRADGFGADVELIDAVGDLADHRDRLRAENQRLRADLADGAAENQRLRDELDETEESSS